MRPEREPHYAFNNLFTSSSTKNSPFFNSEAFSVIPQYPPALNRREIIFLAISRISDSVCMAPPGEYAAFVFYGNRFIQERNIGGQSGYRRIFSSVTGLYPPSARALQIFPIIGYDALIIRVLFCILCVPLTESSG